MAKGLCRCDSLKTLRWGFILDWLGGPSAIMRVLERVRGGDVRKEAEAEQWPLLAGHHDKECGASRS